MPDWEAFLGRLREYPRHYHRIQSPCPGERIAVSELELGPLPRALHEMLVRFNGAELFVRAGASLTIFGLSPSEPVSELEWAPDWYIDRFTPLWRAAGSHREADWAIAMTAYGGLVLLDASGSIKEWGTGEREWLATNVPLTEWIDSVFREGEMIMADL